MRTKDRSLASFLFRLRRAADPRAPFVAAFLDDAGRVFHLKRNLIGGGMNL
jgi:hypothetical protein